MPDFMPVYLWSKLLVNKYSGNEHIVFDGTPRKMPEAKVFDSIFYFYGLGKPWVVYLSVEHKESAERLSLRINKAGRADDSKEAIEKRKKAFEEDVGPVIEWYRTNPSVNFLEIDGNRSVEEIHEDIVKRIGLK
jgi:adenylate kinase